MLCVDSRWRSDLLKFFFFSVTNHASEKEKDYVSAKVLEELDPSSDSECTSGSHNPGTDSLSGRIGTEQKAKSQPMRHFQKCCQGEFSWLQFYKWGGDEMRDLYAS